MYSSSRGGFLSPRLTVESQRRMRRLERSALLDNPQGLTPKQDV